VRAGTPTGSVRRVRELRGAMLSIAGHDHPCASVGAGATALRDVFDSCGTAEAIVTSTTAPVAAELTAEAVARGITVGCHVVPRRAVLLGFFKAGLALDRFLRLLGVDGAGEARDALDRESLDAVAGSLVVEGMADDLQRVTGIGPDASRGSIWRAAQEAAAREAARILGLMEEVAGLRERLVVGGGWARSAAYRAIKREVLGSFEVPDVAEAGARGAALFGGLAAGLYGSVHELPAPGTLTV
jgi:sugar (pentulose or hexulose) kinase